MKRIAVLVVLVGCDGETQPGDVDAVQADAQTDARAIDAALSCTPSSSTQPTPGAVAPVPGVYCATWTRVDGQQDPFARYYDRADVTLTGVRWSSSDGGKEYVTAAEVTGGCLGTLPFAPADGGSRSGPLALCWENASIAVGDMAWCSGGLRDAHWTVRLVACP